MKAVVMCLQLEKCMKSKEFLTKTLSEDPTMHTAKMMEKYAKHIIDVNFCDGSPIDFKSMTIEQLERTHEKISALVEWVNT